MEKEKKGNVYVIILAGGSGTRLWPLSRELTPKQLIRLVGEGSLLDQTIERGYLLSSNPPIIVTNSKIHGQIDKNKLKKEADFLLEPRARNTAPAIALAAKRVAEQDPEGIMVILSADHHIDDKNFTPFLEGAVKTATETGRIVLVGIKPTRPETGYGYIQMGEKLDDSSYKITDFKEKPEKEVAKNYLEAGNYLWNAGIFIAKAKTLLTEFEKYVPSIASLLEADNLEKAFDELESLSIDEGLLEKTENIAVVPADAEWNDLGSWGSIYDISPLDRDKNYLEGDIVSEETTGSLIMARGNRRVATVGVKNLVIVDTEDVTLVCDRDKSQNVKKIVERIKNRG